LWWFCTARPQTRFLDPRGPAQWVVFPTPSGLLAHAHVERTVTFRRTFSLAAAPAAALLRLRGMERFQLELNGDVLPPAEGGADWKQPAAYDGTGHLKAGQNQVTVWGWNGGGPPALWLWLAAGEVVLVTDATWEASAEGALWQPARPAAAGVERDVAAPFGGAERTGTSLVSRLPTLLLFCGLACGVVLGVPRLAADRDDPLFGYPLRAWALAAAALAC